MNTYSKYAPNVFLAKCTEEHKKEETIFVTTRYGKENESIIFNNIYQRDKFFYYSIVRADGFNVQEWARNKSNKLQNSYLNSKSKSNDYWKTSNKDSDFLSMGEPIKIGHHSEKRHRKTIEQAQNNMSKSMEFSNNADEYKKRAEYWEGKTNVINLSMPESIDYFKFQLEKAQLKHKGMKEGTIERGHSFSLTYAKKEVNEACNKLKLALKLWS